MEQMIWSKSEEKWAYFLVLRGQEIHLLKVTGNMLTLKKNVARATEAIQQGQDFASIGAKTYETIDLRTMSKAEVAPGNGSLTLYGDGEKPKSLVYTTSDSDADVILQAILAQSGRTFEESKEEIGVVEALIPPAFLGVIVGGFWFGVYYVAGQIEAGEDVEAKGRKKGLQQILIWVAETLGPKGTIALGVVLLLLFVGWGARRIIKRPERTVWLPAKA